MSQKHQTGQRLLCAAGITLALLGLVSTATAQEAQSDALTVVRDPGTGKLRSATAEEQEALKAQAQSSTARVRTLRAATPQQFQQKIHASGARGVRLTDEFTSSVRAERQPDGSIKTFESQNADQSAAPGHVHTNKVETE